jgi:hypothetical protein
MSSDNWEDIPRSLEDLAFKDSSTHQRDVFLHKQPPLTDSIARQSRLLGDILKESIERNSRDMVNHPPHYTQHPSGVECIQVTEHMNFCMGNAVKYIWRAGLKSSNPIQDLQKAVFYLNREIQRLSTPK